MSAVWSVAVQLQKPIRPHMAAALRIPERAAAWTPRKLIVSSPGLATLPFGMTVANLFVWEPAAGMARVVDEAALMWPLRWFAAGPRELPLHAKLRVGRGQRFSVQLRNDSESLLREAVVTVLAESAN